MLWQYTKQDTVKNFFPLPNEIFSLGLSSGELAVYSYLLFCEDRKTYQCWPSYRSIGKAVHMSTNTVRKYVAALEENGLIVTEPSRLPSSTAPVNTSTPSRTTSTAARTMPSSTRTASASASSTPTSAHTWYPTPGATTTTRPTPWRSRTASGTPTRPSCRTSKRLPSISPAKKKDGSGKYPPKFYYICKNGRRASGRECTYLRNIREEVLDEQVVKVVQQAVNSMYVNKGLITSLCNTDELDELTAKLDGLRAEQKKAEKKKSRLLDRIEHLDEDDDQYDATFNDLQGILRRHNQSIAELNDQIEEVSIRLHNARDGAVSLEETLHMFHQSMGTIESWPAEQLRAFLHNFLVYVEIFPQPLPGGRMVRKIRFKFPVSVDGGLTYSEVVDLDDGTTPDGGPPSGGGGPLPPITPYDDSDLPIDGILPLDGGDFMSDNVLPNPSTASGMLGHYSAEFTLDVYTNVTKEMQKDAAKKIGGFMAEVM